LLWVGNGDLEVEFVVVDADTGAPVEGAEVTVDAIGEWHAGADKEREAGGFTLRTDGSGSARRVCRDTKVVGEDSALGFTNHRSVYMPYWSFHVSAPSYLTSEAAILDQPEYRRAVRWVGHRAYKLEVRVRLQRLRAEPTLHRTAVKCGA
jgi:hypothetical protein